MTRISLLLKLFCGMCVFSDFFFNVSARKDVGELTSWSMFSLSKKNVNECEKNCVLLVFQ